MMFLSAAQRGRFHEVFPAVRENEVMARRTYLKIGGPAALFLEADSADQVVTAVGTARELEIPWYVFGGGSNLLVADEGYQGVVIQMTDRRFTIDGTAVRAAAGAFTGRVARATADAGLAGFEWGVGVPGTMGGATYGNAGCFGGEMKDAVATVDAYDVVAGSRVSLTNEDCYFGYRDSRFKKERFIILETVLSLRPGDRDAALAETDRIMAARKDSQPQGAFSAGCLFKNLDYTSDSDLALVQSRGIAVPEKMLAQKRLGAGWLIETLGLKGTSVGQAQISPVHGNFLVNKGGATAKDILALAALIKEKVRTEYGLELEDEVQVLGGDLVGA